jgi:hypothetical protein
MFEKHLGRAAARIVTALAAAAALVAAASPAGAQVAIRPHQYFTGLVIGKTKLSVIDVLCAGPANTGHPAAGQSVEVRLMVPSAATTGGYTGNHANRIHAVLIWPVGPVLLAKGIATLTHYSVKMPIPTKIKVPCSGTGTMSFNAEPDPDQSATPAMVNVTFFSNGV